MGVAPISAVQVVGPRLDVASSQVIASQADRVAPWGPVRRMSNLRFATPPTRLLRLAKSPRWAQQNGPLAGFASSQAEGLASSLVDLLRRDTSAYAIPASSLYMVADIEVDIQGLAADGRAYSTRKQQRSDWKHWEATKTRRSRTAHSFVPTRPHLLILCLSVMC